MTFSRHWQMPNADTFSIPIIGSFVKKYMHVSKVSVDPFARNSRFATHTNDLNPNTAAANHMDAVQFLDHLNRDGVKADLIILDPPYSPRQISECYQEAGLKASMQDTQNAALYSKCRKAARAIASDGAIVLSFGWNSVGIGKGFEILELMLVCHGGAHNDTICMAERKLNSKQGDIL